MISMTKTCAESNKTMSHMLTHTYHPRRRGGRLNEEWDAIKTTRVREELHSTNYKRKQITLQNPILGKNTVGAAVEA